MPLVIDASLTLSWCFASEASAYGRSVLDALERTYAVVPAIWAFEIANGLAMAEKRNRITRQGVDEFLGTLARLPIHIERWEASLIRQLRCQSHANAG